MIDLHYFQACQHQIDSRRTPVFRGEDKAEVGGLRGFSRFRERLEAQEPLRSQISC